MKTTYTVPEVPGSKRTSERPYTHAVIGYDDPQRRVAAWLADHEANGAKYRRWSIKNWQDNRRAAAVKEGEMYVNHNGFRVEARQAFIDIAAGFMAKYPTLEGYLAHEEQDFQDRVAAERARPNGPVVVLRWSMSRANASKGLSEFDRSYSGIKIVECVPVTK